MTATWIMEVPVTLGAEDPLIAVGVRVPFDPPDASVFHIGKDGAAISAPVAKGGDAPDRRLDACLGPVVEIEESEGKGAGGDRGSL